MAEVRQFSLPKLKLWSALVEEKMAQEALLLSAAVWDPKQVGGMLKTIKGELLAQSTGEPADTVSQTEDELLTPRCQEDFERMRQNA